jgi:hypothetical protein
MVAHHPKNPPLSTTIRAILYRKDLYSLAIPYLEQSLATQPTGLRKVSSGGVLKIRRPTEKAQTGASRLANGPDSGRRARAGDLRNHAGRNEI